MSGVAYYQSCFNDRVSTDALGSLRQKAIEHFVAAGFPTTQDEEWAFTNIAPLTRNNFELAESTTVPAAVEDYRYGLKGLVFVDGHFAGAHSDLNGLPNDVFIERLSIAAGTIIVAALGRAASTEGEAFTALNTAFWQDGAIVHITSGVVVEQPIHLLFVSTGQRAHVVSHPRVLVVAGPNSQATVVESYIGLGAEPYLTNSVSELFLGHDAVLDHYRVQRESAAAFHVAATHVYEERASQFRSTSINLGGRLTRHHVHTALAGEGVDSTLNGLYIADGGQHVDNHTLIEHAEPNCQSHEFYKGILGGRATGVFRGKIHVHQAAQKTDAYQANQNLLLSATAQINTKPQLEIYADDVKCSHGATIGQLDADALFYLRSRGMGHREAVRVLTRAFAGEVLDRVRIPVLKDSLNQLVDRRLDQAAAGVAL